MNIVHTKDCAITAIMARDAGQRTRCVCGAEEKMQREAIHTKECLLEMLRVTRETGNAGRCVCGSEFEIVIVESPYAPRTKKPEQQCNGYCRVHPPFMICDLCLQHEAFDTELARNMRYLRAAMRDCIVRGESPYASHALLTQPGVLDDLKPEERERGIRAGYAFWSAAKRIVFYTDLGYSSGMTRARDRADILGIEAVERTLPGWVR